MSANDKEKVGELRINLSIKESSSPEIYKELSLIPRNERGERLRQLSLVGLVMGKFSFGVRNVSVSENIDVVTSTVDEAKQDVSKDVVSGGDNLGLGEDVLGKF